MKNGGRVRAEISEKFKILVVVGFLCYIRCKIVCFTKNKANFKQ